MSLRVRLFAACATAAAALVTTLAAVPASAAEPVSPELVSVASVDGEGGWASIEYIESHPAEFSEPVRELAAVASEGTGTLSASGCNIDVCIAVEGQSTLVTRWSSQAFGNVGCTIGIFDYPNGDYETPVICPNSGGQGVYFWNAGPTGVFTNRSWLFNTWNRIAGRPGIEIRA